VGAKPNGTGIARQFAGKKPATEVLILYQEVFAIDLDPFEEAGIVTIATNP
jgi:hypothetical protein